MPRTGSDDVASTDDLLVIASGDAEAAFDPVGARLAWLRTGGVDLVVPELRRDPTLGYRGAVVAPWPNRIADGTYTFAGRQHWVPVNEPDRRTALHGLASWVDWAPHEHGADRLVLTTSIGPVTGWPFRLDLLLAATVDATGLRLDLTATNRGDGPLPYGCTIHPYLRCPTGTVDDWWLRADTARVMEVTPDRLLPVDVVDVDGSVHDLRAGVGLHDRPLDHAHTGIGVDDDGLARVRLWDDDGQGVVLTWDVADSPWLQVFTMDADRAGVAVEPMTCPPDAYNSGTDLVVLEPGQQHAAWWRIDRASDLA